MNEKRLYRFGVLYLVILLSGCSNEASKEETVQNIPEQFREMENLKVITPDQEVQTYHLEYVQAFGDTSEVIYDFFFSFSVDDSGRVFLGENSQSRKAIHVFEPDGSYLTTIGREGRGPGEFTRVTNIHIINNNLYVYDISQKRISIFDLQDLAYSETIQFHFDGIPDTEEFAGLRERDMVKVAHDGSFLMVSSSPPPMTLYNTSQDSGRTAAYFYRDEEGGTIPKLVFRTKEPSHYISDESSRDGFVLPFTAPYTRSSLLSVAADGTIHTAWTEDYLIKVYDRNGVYQRAFYYPYEKSELSNTEALSFVHNRESERIIRDQGFPDTWPALHTIVLDDENRLWIATITDDEDHFQWWVLEETGELLATFQFPGKRTSRNIEVPPSIPSIVIKNGYFYRRERDEETGLQRVVKYRIDMGSGGLL